MNTKDILERIKALDEQGIAKREYTAISELRDLYSLAFGETVQDGCGDCVRKAYGKLQLLTFKKIEQMTNSKFKLKDDVLLPVGDFGTSEFLSKDNLTDELAYQVLAKFPSLIGQFADYPKDENGNLLAQGAEAPAEIENAEFVPLNGADTPTPEDVEKALATLKAAGHTLTPLAGQELAAANIVIPEPEPAVDPINTDTEPAPATDADTDPEVDPNPEPEPSYEDYLKGKDKTALQEIYKDETKKEPAVRWGKDVLIANILKAQEEPAQGE